MLRTTQRLLLAAVFLAAVFLAAAPQTAQAQRWQDIGKTSTGNTVYLDPRSVSKAPDGIITATVRVVYTTAIDTPQGPITGSRSIAMFDCPGKKVAVKENIIWHNEARGTMYRKSNPALPGFGPALTSTFAYVALEYLCKQP